MQEEIVFAGFGGQGVMFVGQLLAYAAMDAGLHVTWIPSYGPEMRGGTAHCFVVISDKEIGSPLVQHPKIALVFNKPSYDKYEPQITAKGLLLVNSSLVSDETGRSDIQKLAIPATAIADRLGSTRVTNLVMLGALLASSQILPLELVKTALAQHLPAHRYDLLALNYRALEEGALISTQQAV